MDPSEKAIYVRHSNFHRKISRLEINCPWNYEVLCILRSIKWMECEGSDLSVPRVHKSSSNDYERFRLNFVMSLAHSTRNWFYSTMRIETKYCNVDKSIWIIFSPRRKKFSISFDYCPIEMRNELQQQKNRISVLGDGSL